MRRAIALGAGLLMVGAAVTGCGGRQDKPAADTGGEVTCEVSGDTRIAIATGNATGVYFALGNAYAEQISSATGGKVKATAAETGASVQNIQQLVGGALPGGVLARRHRRGRRRGQGRLRRREAADPGDLARSTPTTRRWSSGPTRASGRSPTCGASGSRPARPSSGTEVIANRLIESAGLNPQSDVAAQRLDLTKTVDGMKDGSIDAMFWSGGLPTPGITDLFTTRRDAVRFLDITPQLPKMQKISPVYEEGVIPAATYGTPADAKTIVVPNLLLVRDDIDANLACVLTKTLFDRKPQLEQAVGAAKGIKLETARDTGPVPLNRGAEKALGQLAPSQ